MPIRGSLADFCAPPERAGNYLNRSSGHCRLAGNLRGCNDGVVDKRKPNSRRNKMLLDQNTRPPESNRMEDIEHMPLEGRSERRLPLTLPVRLSDLRPCRSEETALTENVSVRGLRVVTKQSWLPGDDLRVSSLTNRFSLIATIAYCESLSKASFCIGLRFNGPCVIWWRWFSSGSRPSSSEPDAAV